MLIEGALILLGGLLIGRFMPARPRAPKPRPEPQPVCGCTHGYHDHDPASGACHGKTKAYRFSTSFRREVFDKYVGCTCRRYVGPEPLPSFTAEIGGGR